MQPWDMALLMFKICSVWFFVLFHFVLFCLFPLYASHIIHKWHLKRFWRKKKNPHEKNLMRLTLFSPTTKCALEPSVLCICVCRESGSPLPAELPQGDIHPGPRSHLLTLPLEVVANTGTTPAPPDEGIWASIPLTLTTRALMVALEASSAWGA